MLKYTIQTRKTGNDIEYVNYNDIVLTDYIDVYGDDMMVTLVCDGEVKVRTGDTITAVTEHVVVSDDGVHMLPIPETGQNQVHSTDYAASMFTVIASKYKELDCTSIMLEQDNQLGLCLVMGFSDRHLLDRAEELTPEGEGQEDVSGDVLLNHLVYIMYGSDRYVRLCGVNAVDMYTVQWQVDPGTENFMDMCSEVFPSWDGDMGVETVYGEESRINVRRTQTMWGGVYESMPAVSFEHPMTIVNVPLSIKHDVRLYREMNIKEKFLDDSVEGSINGYREMEKHIYKPAFIADGSSEHSYGFGLVRRINFNLHFRTHSGEDWITENGDSWNFVEYGSPPSGENYYSFENRSNQADLLCYLGFSNNDVKYQKNKLKKSFLRLSFYDSDNPGSQSLLAYYTVFIDGGRLYARYMNSAVSPIYKNLDGDVLVGAKVNREVCEEMLGEMLGMQVAPDDDTIEEYRLSSRITVEDPALSEVSSEGFNVHLWADEDNGVIPGEIYMKAEFNHAGYGRSIPMMAPFKYGNGERGFKTNSEIAADWTDLPTQYGMGKYKRFSYIKFKRKYDKGLNKHIYYLDPERYGVQPHPQDVLNINLYEARVAFND